MFTPTSYYYFLMQKLNRYNFVRNLLADCYNEKERKKKTFLSVGCGLAGEESWLPNQFKEVVLLDRDGESLKAAKKFYLQDKIKGNFKFQKLDIQHGVTLDKKYDIIFTCSPTDWMDNSDWDLPPAWISFLDNHLADNGLFIFRVYGGNGNRHPENFKENLHKYLLGKACDLKIQGIWHISKQEINEQNKLKGLPTENGKGRFNQAFGFITKKSAKIPKNVSFYNYDKDNIYPIQFLKTWEEEEFITVCRNRIKILEKSKLKKKLLTKEFI